MEKRPLCNPWMASSLSSVTKQTTISASGGELKLQIAALHLLRRLDRFTRTRNKKVIEHHHCIQISFINLLSYYKVYRWIGVPDEQYIPRETLIKVSNFHKSHPVLHMAARTSSSINHSIITSDNLIVATDAAYRISSS